MDTLMYRIANVVGFVLAAVLLTEVVIVCAAFLRAFG